MYRILFGQDAPYKMWGEVFPGPGTCQLYVKTLTGKTEAFRVNLEEPVRYLMLAIQERWGFPPDYHRLFFGGYVLEPGRAFSDYKVEINGQMVNLIGAESTLQLVLGYSEEDFGEVGAGAVGGGEAGAEVNPVDGEEAAAEEIADWVHPADEVNIEQEGEAGDEESVEEGA